MTTYETLPPQNLEAEEYVLGAMLISQTAVENCSEIVSAGDFYRESHARIYRAIMIVHNRGEAVDAITVADQLETVGELEWSGGKEKLQELATLVPATTNAPHHAKKVLEMAQLRGLERVGQELLDFARNRPGETKELMEKAEQLVFGLNESRNRTDLVEMREMLKDGFDHLTKLYESGAVTTGTPTCFRDIDEMTSGLHKGELVIAAARPSMGKSAFALAISLNLTIRRGIPVAMFTLEMSKSEITQRAIAFESRVNLHSIRTGKISPPEWGDITRICNDLSEAPLYVDDTASITLSELRSKARRLKSRIPNLGLIVVDYLQLMSGADDIYTRVTENSRSLKILARDLDIPILALAQLNRQLESRGDKRPMLSDLRDSGALEQDADVVFFLYRDEVYDKDSIDVGLAEVIMAKNRNGPIGSVKLAFRKEQARFSDLRPM